jgi:hypothetical protein
MAGADLLLEEVTVVSHQDSGLAETRPIVGTPIRAGLNRNCPWALAQWLAAYSGMTNQSLKDQGLIPVKEQWVKIHYPATAR